jgi:hypothetical protein
MADHTHSTRVAPSSSDAARLPTRAGMRALPRSAPPAGVADQQGTLSEALNQGPPVQSIAQLQRTLNQSPRVARVAKAAALLQRRPRATSQSVVQRVWVDAGRQGFRWHTLLDGLQWYFDPATGAFHYHIVDDLAVPIALWTQIEANEGRRLSEQQLADLGFQRIAVAPEEARVVEERSDEVPAAGMVSKSVSERIAENIRSGIPPFKPELGLGGCSWFIWKGHGVPYTSIDKVKGGGEPKNIEVDATVRLPEYPLIITTAFLAARHAMYMQDAGFRADAERRWRTHNAVAVDAELGRRQRDNLAFYMRGLAEHQMWVSIGHMVAAHPSRVGVVILTGSEFSKKEGDGRFLVVADASRIEVLSMKATKKGPGKK